MDAFLLKSHTIVFQEIRPIDLFVLLCAFLYGNLFVITFSGMNWGLLLISFIVVFLEVLNTLLYFSFFKKKSQKKKTNKILPVFFSSWFSAKKKNTGISLSFLVNTIKRGFLLGFFIEAFKVGS